METGRPREYSANWAVCPGSSAHTVAHEIGHLFDGRHIDGGLMNTSGSRMVGTFDLSTLKRIRVIVYP